MRTRTFISIDGPNGVGKSTLVRGIAEALRQQGLTVHVTKEVTETVLGSFVRENHRHFRGKTLALLLAADRQNHLDSDIIPAFETHDVVITDRYLDSSLVFQRLDGVDLAFLWKINSDFLRPDLSIIVVAPGHVIVSRMASREVFDRFESEFSRDAEANLYREAADFLEGKGFNVRLFDNGEVSELIATRELCAEVLAIVAKAKRSMPR